MFLPNKKTVECFFGFFTAHIRNPNTRRAYYRAACRFSDWCQGRGVQELAHVTPLHVAAYIEMLGLAEPDGAGLSKPTVKQHLAALRMLFDWLVVGHIIEINRRRRYAGLNTRRRRARRRCSTARKRGR